MTTEPAATIRTFTVLPIASCPPGRRALVIEAFESGVPVMQAELTETLVADLARLLGLGGGR